MPTKKQENKTETEKFLFGTREEQIEVMDRWKKQEQEEQAEARAAKPAAAEATAADDTPPSTPDGRNSVN